MARYRTVAVVALLVVAGCQGFDTDADTVTPAPVPSATGPETVDANAIADRHRRALTNQSHATTVALTVEYPNGTTAQLTDEFAVRSDDSYRYDRQRRGPYPQNVSNLTIWQTSATEYRRETADDGPPTVRVRNSSGFQDSTFAGFLGSVLAGFDRTAERANGRTVLSGRQNGPLTVPLPSALRNGDNGTLEAEIRDGIVRSMTVTARADYPEIGQPVTVRLQVTVQGVGRTEPTRPAWATDNETG